jgi:prolyl-tRNA synthetase
LRFTELGIKTLREPQHPLLVRAGYFDGRTPTALGRLLLAKLFPGGIEERTQEQQRPRHGLLVGREYLVAPGADVPPSLPVVADGERLVSPHPLGDEEYGRCAECGYEGFEVGWPAAPSSDEPMVEHHTPDCPGIDAVVAHFEGLTAAEMLKCFAAGDTVVLVPGDRKVRLPLAGEPRPDLPVGYIGPMGLQARGITVLADNAVRARPGPWTTGANRDEHHVTGATLGRDFEVDAFGPFATLADGDPCPRCGAPMALQPAFEVRSERGTVGAGRCAQLLADLHHDDAGLVWPPEIAPFRAHLVTIRIDAEDQEDVLWDDRDASPGAKFADADLLGMPVQLILGPKAAAAGQIEVKNRRTGDRRYEPLDG